MRIYRHIRQNGQRTLITLRYEILIKLKNDVNACSIVEPSGKSVLVLATQLTTPATSVNKLKSQQSIETSPLPPRSTYNFSRHTKASVFWMPVMSTDNDPKMVLNRRQLLSSHRAYA